MLFVLITAAKVNTKIEYPNIFLLFYRKFMFLQSKNCRLRSKNSDREKENKNPYPSKNYYLKITIISKNYRLKILVRVYACMYARVYDWRK